MLIKKAFAVLPMIFLLSLSAFAAPEISAKSAAVINAETLEAVYEKNARQSLPMASTTKIMTALVALESGKILETVTVTANMAGAEGTSIGLREGYKIKLIDLLFGMMLESGNDAADAAAVFTAGSREKFAQLMNEKAKQIGLESTNFVTPSGLDSEGHLTTAHDMALLGAYAVKNPMFRALCSSKKKTVRFLEPALSMTFSNHNRFFRGMTERSESKPLHKKERQMPCFRGRKGRRVVHMRHSFRTRRLERPQKAVRLCFLFGQKGGALCKNTGPYKRSGREEPVCFGRAFGQNGIFS